MNTQTKSVKTVQIANIIAFIVVLSVNVLSNALPLNGRTAGEISDALPSYFTPAGYTFSIWLLIYIGLLGFIIYQALPAQRKRPFLPQIGLLFVLSSMINAAWLISWHYGAYFLSVIFMISLLLTLIGIYVRLDNGRIDKPFTERLLVQVPFSLYLGWITVATIANIASVTAYWGWNGFGIAAPIWSAIMMGAAVIIAGLLLITRSDLPYAGVLVWALFGIRAAYPETAVVANTALIAAGLIVVPALIGLWRTRYANSITKSLA